MILVYTALILYYLVSWTGSLVYIEEARRYSNYYHRLRLLATLVPPIFFTGLLLYFLFNFIYSLIYKALDEGSE